MIKTNIILCLGLCFLSVFQLQLSAQVVMPYCQDEAYDEKVRSMLSFSIPVMDVDQLYEESSNYVILDAREKKEYETSHIPNALFLGFKKPNYDLLDEIDSSKKIVLYCSIGFRSEKLAEKLEAKGFEVYNLYGSIFEWANRGYPLEDISDNQTNNVHTYNRNWSQWLLNPEMNKVY